VTKRMFPDVSWRLDADTSYFLLISMRDHIWVVTECDREHFHGAVGFELMREAEEHFAKRVEVIGADMAVSMPKFVQDAFKYGFYEDDAGCFVKLSLVYMDGDDDGL
jgi:hypothetical protein